MRSLSRILECDCKCVFVFEGFRVWLERVWGLSKRRPPGRSFTSSWCSSCSGSWSRPDCCPQSARMQRTPAEQHMQASVTFHSSCCQRSHQSYLVIPLTQELQPLSSFVHEDTIKVAGLHWSDLNGLFSPSHDLIWANVSCGQNVMVTIIIIFFFFCVHIRVSFCFVDMSRTNRCRHLAPLQDHIFNDPTVGVDIDAFILVTQEHFHAIWAGKEHYCMWRHLALDLFEMTVLPE